MICTDSMAALTSLLSDKLDLVVEVVQCLFRIRQLMIVVKFLCVPSDVGGNEEVDLLAKKELNHPQI